jgi:hypothetical protein
MRAVVAGPVDARIRERFAAERSFRALCALLLLFAVVVAVPAQGQVTSVSAADGASAAKHVGSVHVQQARQQKMPGKARNYYITAFGVENLHVSYTASGNLIRFTYRVAEPERAKVLADKRNAAYLVGQRSRAVLQVPVMDKVGMLRQAATPVPGQEYWMVFSNKGNLVRQGDRVNVVIGSFHADGLMVE